MRLSIIVTAFLIILLSAGISSKTQAAPWRGYHRHGWYRPRPVVRIYTPPVVIGRYDEGYYRHPHYYAPRYENRRYHGGYRYYGPHHGHR